jgi:hypothetical protein
MLLASHSARAVRDPPATPPPRFSSAVYVSAVTLSLRAVDEAGKAVGDLEPGDLEVSEDGVPVRVLDLSRLSLHVRAPMAPAVADTQGTPAVPPPLEADHWRTVLIWVVPELTHRGSLPRSVDKLRRASSRLTALAPVSVVVEDGAPRVIGEDLQTPEALEQALADPSLGRMRWNSILRIREDLLRQDFLTDGLGFPAFAYRFALAAASDESTLVQAHLGILAGWAGEHASSHGPGLIILVANGFGDGREDFYVQLLASLTRARHLAPDRDKLAQLEALRLDHAVDGVTEALTHAGWVMVTLDTGAQWATDTRFPIPLLSPSCTFCMPALEPELIRRPGVSLEHLANQTGGGVVRASEALPAALDRLAGIYRLVYQADRPPDEREHQVSITCRRPGIEVFGPSKASQTPPGSLAVSRAVASLAGLGHGHGLNVKAAVVQVSRFGRRLRGSLRVRVRLGSLAQGLQSAGTAQFRVTVAVEMERGQPFVHQEEFDAKISPETARWDLTSPIQWSPDGLRLSVLVEDLASGRWGVAEAQLPEGP